MSEMIAESSEGDFSAVKTATFHHWWTPVSRFETGVCNFLEVDCIVRLRLIEGKALDSPPLEICASRCVATYKLTELSKSSSQIIIPLNYDSVLRAEVDGRRLLTRNFAGLLAVDTDGVGPGVITVSVQPDGIMRLRALSPLACLGLALLVIVRAISRSRRKMVAAL